MILDRDVLVKAAVPAGPTGARGLLVGRDRVIFRAEVGGRAGLHGRAAERLVIDRLLADARSGRSGALVIRGEAGVGKTALLDYAVAAVGAVVLEAACGDATPGDVARPGTAAFRVLRGEAVPSEAELPFAGVHLLLGSVLDRRMALPRPQRQALDAALRGRRGGSDDRFLAGLAVLSLLGELAEDGPLLCLVDDAHWLDRTSAEALMFAARRLGGEGIVLIFAARDHDAPFPAPGLPELRLGGLDTAAAAALLAEHGGAALTAAARDRILAEARGNPLGLIELPAAYRDHAAVVGPAGTGLALTGRLRRAFGGQLGRFPEPTQTLLLVAAAEDSGKLGAVLEAAGLLGAVAGALRPAEQAGLVSVADGTVRFGHPLVRAAVYQGAPLERRLAVHRALAAVLRTAADADRRAWHLAAAATGPDEQVAAELERTAAKAIARGGYAAAGAAYQRSAQLTTDPAAQAGRLMLAAEAAVEVGEYDRAASLASGAGQSSDPALRARLFGVRAQADFARGRVPAAHRLLVEGAAQIADLDPLAATRMLLNAVQIGWFVGDQALLADTAQRLKGLVGSCTQPLVPLVQLTLWSAPQAQERPDHPPRLADVVAAARRSRAGDHHDLAIIAMLCLATGRNADARDITAGLVADAQAQGRTGQLPALLSYLAQALAFDGRHRDALASASKALSIADDTSHLQWTIEATAIMAYLAAVEGDQGRCRRLADAALAEAAAHTASAYPPLAHCALGLLDLGCGRPHAALARLEAIIRGPMRHHASTLRSIPDLVEAAVRLGQPQRAAEPLARFAQWARHADMPNTDALVERCHALLETDRDPERHYLAALEFHQPSFQQARTQLLYGTWLRRARRKTHARTQLHAAAEYLDQIDATPWAHLARVELTATGTTTRQPDQSGLPWLTPQELQVTRLAAQGLSNRDIAAQLFLSPRTVGYHLYKAYPKLGITSRNQLDPDTLRP